MICLLSGTVIGLRGVIVEVTAEVRKPSSPVSAHEREALRGSAIRSRGVLAALGLVAPVDVTFAPADLRLDGQAMDLPATLAAYGAQRPAVAEALRGYLIVGGLSLEGALCPVRGVLSLAIAAREHGLKGIIVPAANVNEAATVSGITVLGFRDIRDVLAWTRGMLGKVTQATADVGALLAAGTDSSSNDFAHVHGLEPAKRALEIAAAGGHDVLLVGSPGSSKILLGKCLGTILPALSYSEAVETTQIYSVAGLLPENEALVTRRPFRCPHSTISDVGLVGGGTAASPRPGEATLAHNGVLFLDELLDFNKPLLETLRSASEQHSVTTVRAPTAIRYPASFLLVSAASPCPCGYAGHADYACSCTPAAVTRWAARIGAWAAHTDIHVELPVVSPREPAAGAAHRSEGSAAIRARVEAARAVQRKRFTASPRVHTNAQMTQRLIQRTRALAPEARQLLDMLVIRFGFSEHARLAILRISRTIADLAGAPDIRPEHVAEAVQYRRRAPRMG